MQALKPHRRVRGGRPGLVTLGFGLAYYRTADMPVDVMREIAQAVGAPKKRRRGDVDGLRVWLLEHWRRGKVRTSVLAACSTSFFTSGVLREFRNSDEDTALEILAQQVTLAHAHGVRFAYGAVMATMWRPDGGRRLRSRFLSLPETRHGMREMIRDPYWRGMLRYLRSVRERDRLLSEASVGDVIMERVNAAQAVAAMARADEAERNLEDLYEESLRTIGQLEEALATERQRHADELAQERSGHAEELRAAYATLRGLASRENAVGEVVTTLPQTLWLLEHKSVLVIGDPGRTGGYTAVLKELGAREDDVSILDGMRVHPLRALEMAQGADVVVVVKAYVKHKVTQTLQANGIHRKTVFVPKAGLAQMRDSLAAACVVEAAAPKGKMLGNS